MARHKVLTTCLTAMPTAQMGRQRIAAPMPGERAGVVHIVQKMEPGGIQTLILDLLGSASSGDRIISLESTRDRLIADWPRLAQLHDRIDAFDLQPGLSPSLVYRLTRRLRQLRPSAAVVHHIGPFLYGGTATRLAGVPRLIHVEHDIWHYAAPRRKMLSRLCARILRPQHVAVSEAVAEGLADIAGGNPIHVIYPGIDTVRFSPCHIAIARNRTDLPRDLRIIGTAGRLDPVKGHIHLVRALAQLPEDVHLIIVGEGDERDSIAATAASLGITGRCHLLGHRDDLDRLLPAFDVFALPSLNEGLPRVILEAQACGVPVVASSVGAIPRAVAPATGRLVEPGDEQALAGALLATLEGEGSDATNSADLTRAFVTERFSLDLTTQAYRRLTGA